jgi:hypothetical protein
VSENARIGQQRPLRHAMGEWHGTYLLFLLAQSEVALDLLLLELLLGRQDLLAHLPSLDLAFAFGLKRKKKKKSHFPRRVDRDQGGT